jgi:hypothetical protein
MSALQQAANPLLVKEIPSIAFHIHYERKWGPFLYPPDVGIIISDPCKRKIFQKSKLMKSLT